MSRWSLWEPSRTAAFVLTVDAYPRLARPASNLKGLRGAHDALVAYLDTEGASVHARVGPLDAAAALSALWAFLEWLDDHPERDRVFLGLAGHGSESETGPWLHTSEFERPDRDGRAGVSLPDCVEVLRSATSPRTVFGLVDLCRLGGSAAVRGAHSGFRASGAKVVEQSFLCSCGEGRVAPGEDHLYAAVVACIADPPFVHGGEAHTMFDLHAALNHWPGPRASRHRERALLHRGAAPAVFRTTP